MFSAPASHGRATDLAAVPPATTSGGDPMKSHCRRMRLNELEPRALPSSPGDIDWLRQFGSGFGGSDQGLDPAAAEGEQVPLQGRLEGDVTRTPAPPLVLVDIEATGTATQLGHFTLDVPHVMDPATRTAVGSYRFTAANGDTLYAEFTGQATPTAIPGVLYVEE